MTGRRVVFMVDMSGSMAKTDADTEAPHKWPTVAETVAKGLRLKEMPAPAALRSDGFALCE